MSRSALVSSLLTTAALLAGCGGEDGTDTSPDAGDRPTASAEPMEPSTSAPAGPTVSGTVDEPPDGTAGDGGGSGGPAPVTEQPPAPEGPVLPDEVVPVHGGQVWAVYLAVRDPGDPTGQRVLAETADHVHAVFGYTGSGIGEVSCDQGAAEQLGFDPEHHRVAVYFESATRAQEFVAVYDRQDVGSAPVTTYCLD